ELDVHLVGIELLPGLRHRLLALARHWLKASLEQLQALLGEDHVAHARPSTGSCSAYSSAQARRKSRKASSGKRPSTSCRMATSSGPTVKFSRSSVCATARAAGEMVCRSISRLRRLAAGTGAG